MDIRSELDLIRQNMKDEQISSHTSINEVVDYFKSSKSLGAMSLVLFAQNEISPFIDEAFSDGLLKATMREYNWEQPGLLASDYPASRWGDYLRDLLFIIAISPGKALVFSNNPNVVVYDHLKPHVRARLINLYSLAKARTAYYFDETQGEFVSAHLGWALNRSTLSKQRDYVKDFLLAENAWDL